jgi:hypothetical protein
MSNNCSRKEKCINAWMQGQESAWIHGNQRTLLKKNELQSFALTKTNSCSFQRVAVIAELCFNMGAITEGFIL